MLFDGVPTPLVYIRRDAISVIVPYAIAGHSSTLVQVEYRDQLSTPMSISAEATAPGIFTDDSSGQGQAAALNDDSTINSSTNPAARGSIVVLYGTGEGQTNPMGIDGKPASAPLPSPLAPVSVKIGGQDAEVIYAGASAGLVAGVLQVNVRVPLSAATGAAVSVVLHAADLSSPSSTTLAIR